MQKSFPWKRLKSLGNRTASSSSIGLMLHRLRRRWKCMRCCEIVPHVCHAAARLGRHVGGFAHWFGNAWLSDDDGVGGGVLSDDEEQGGSKNTQLSSLSSKRNGDGPTAADYWGFKVLVALCVICHVVFFSVAIAQMTTTVLPSDRNDQLGSHRGIVQRVQDATITPRKISHRLDGHSTQLYSPLLSSIKEFSGRVVRNVFHHHWFGSFTHYDRLHRSKVMGTTNSVSTGAVVPLAETIAEDEHDLWFVGVLIALVGTMVAALGNHLVTLAHRLGVAEEANHAKGAGLAFRWPSCQDMLHAVTPGAPQGPQTRHMIHQTLLRPSVLVWLAGNVAITILGTTLTLSSFAFTSQSLLAPLSGLTIVWNALLATLRWFGSVMLSRRDIRATLLTLFGCVFIIIAGPRETRHYNVHQLVAMFGRLAFQAFAFLNVGFILALYHVCDSDTGFLRTHKRLAQGLLPGVVGGFSNVLAKAAVELLNAGALFNSLQALFILLLTVSTAVCQLSWVNKALAMYEPLFIVPVYQATLLVSSTLCGALYYGDFDELSMSQYFAFAIGVMAIVAGVTMLATSSSATTNLTSKSTDGAGRTNRESFIISPEINWATNSKPAAPLSSPPRAKRKSAVAIV